MCIFNIKFLISVKEFYFLWSKATNLNRPAALRSKWPPKLRHGGSFWPEGSRRVKSHILSRYHSNRAICTAFTDYSWFSFNVCILFACWKGQRNIVVKAENLAGPVHGRHRHAREHFVHDRGTEKTRHHHAAAFPFPVSTQRGMTAGTRG